MITRVPARIRALNEVDKLFPLRALQAASRQIRKEVDCLCRGAESDYQSALRVIRVQALHLAVVADEMLSKSEGTDR